jgi:sec-independent protein translocase protein TatA
MFPLTNHLPWVILLIVVLVIFGPKRLPELGSALGRALREFRQATTELKDQVNESVHPQADARPAASESTEPAAAQPETRA